MENFKLNENERAKILEWYSHCSKKKQKKNAKEDAEWIEICVNGNKDVKKMIFFDNKTKRKNSWKTALKKLGRETFFNGLSRACFHWTCGRENISFDCSPCFRS